MDKFLPFDELNKLKAELTEVFETGMQESEREEIMDSLLGVLIMAYVFGTDDANEMLEMGVPVDKDSMEESITKEVAGKTWADRVSEYISTGTAEDIMRVAETDAHRIYNDAIYHIGEVAKAQYEAEETKAEDGSYSSADTGSTEKPKGKIYKTWECMMLPTSRDTHRYLDGTTIPFDERFYTYTGESALRPAEFGSPAEDINCLCRLRLSRRDEEVI